MRYLLRRIGFYLIALWAAITINFLVPHLVPGDPAQIFMSRMRGHASPPMKQSITGTIKPNKNISVKRDRIA